ncbi:Hydroxyacylglutathione hydrolase cytoplasmic [Glycine max]|nr:Hydroxyacylglutathione hydrolase cytoplasmic [Glycine max]
MKIYHVPCLRDNYSYLIVDKSTKEGAVVDPVEPQRVLEAANSHWVNLKLVLTTQHHGDHAGGNEKIKQLVPGIKVYGSLIDNVIGCTDKVENGDKESLGADIYIFHTKGHISYYVTGKEEEQPAVFTGDTLFIADCGKFFKGTAEQMYQSLCVTLGSLPKPTRVYCGHGVCSEELAKNQQQAGQLTISSTIEEEMETNPFKRVDQPDIQEKVGCKSPVEALRELRKLKDNWKG